MTIIVKLFGPDARLAGTREAAVHIDSPSPSVMQVRTALQQQFPSLEKLRFRLAVNHEFAHDDQIVLSQDEIAVIGMVSGG